jgi:hypothetical protein
LAAPDIPQVVGSAVYNLGLMVMAIPSCSSRTRVARGIDFRVIAAQASVWERITTHPEAERARPVGRLMSTLVRTSNHAHW